jgi:sulfite reductase beta subunit-like hemoprotein
MGRGQREVGSGIGAFGRFEPRDIDRQAARDRIASALSQSDNHIFWWESCIRTSEDRAKRLSKAHPRLTALVRDSGVEAMIEALRERVQGRRAAQERLRGYDTEALDLDGLKEAYDYSREIVGVTAASQTTPIERALLGIEDVAWALSDQHELDWEHERDLPV